MDTPLGYASSTRVSSGAGIPEAVSRLASLFVVVMHVGVLRCHPLPYYRHMSCFFFP